MTAVANASADGKTANTLNMSADHTMQMGGYGCTKNCKKVTWGAVSGWFKVGVSGASALVAAASVATIAALI